MGLVAAYCVVMGWASCERVLAVVRLAEVVGLVVQASRVEAEHAEREGARSRWARRGAGGGRARRRWNSRWWPVLEVSRDAAALSTPWAS
jgi:hypothetical protein